MTKEVLISIKGLQFEGDMDADKIETITSGSYYKKNNNHYVIYEEVVEGTEGVTKNIIKFNEKELNLTKSGSVNAHMFFEHKKKNMTNYETPFGDILVGIDAKDISLYEKETEIQLKVDYALEVNYEFLADCKIVMDIRQKDGDGFSLRS